MENSHKIIKQGFKYYIISNQLPAGVRWGSEKLHHPENFQSFFFKKNAQKALVYIQKAFGAGYQHRAYEEVERGRDRFKDDFLLQVQHAAFNIARRID